MTRHTANFRSGFAVFTGAVLLVQSLLSAPAESAAPKADRSVSAAAATNTLDTLDPLKNIPQSVFVAPTAEKEGKDPFFPDSTPQVASPTASKTPDNSSAVELVLQGISGPADKRMAVINNKNFGAGEEVMVPTPTGSVRIHCIEIRTNSVVVEIGSQRRELRLRRGQ